MVDAHDRSPALIVWELDGSSTNDERPDPIHIVEEVGRFGPDQRLLLVGIDRVPASTGRAVVERATDAGLTTATTLADPRGIERTELRALASAGLDALVVRLDGPNRTTHDALHAGVGRFDAAVRLDRWAHELGLDVAVSTTVSTATIGGIDHLAARVVALGAHRWTLSFTVTDQTGIGHQRVDPETAEELLAWLAELDGSSDLTIEVVQAPMYHRIAEGMAGVPSTPPLVAGVTLLHIGPNGGVRPAGTVDERLGRLPDDDLVACYRGHPLAEALRDRSNRSGRCGRCEFNDVCGGSRAQAVGRFGDVFAEDPLCSFVPAVVDGDR